MTIAEVRGKCKSLVAQIPKDLLIVGILVFSSSASFGLGYLAGLDTKQEVLESEQALTTEAEPLTGIIGFVASKNGTKYYPAGCTGADRISLANKVWFASVAAASAAGYTPAANCK